MVIDGKDVFDYQINLPSSLAKYNEGYCYLAGGVIGNLINERHIRLMNADQTNLSWKLGSLYILEGVYVCVYTCVCMSMCITCVYVWTMYCIYVYTGDEF